MFNRHLKDTLARQSETIAGLNALVDAIDRSNARIEFDLQGHVTQANTMFLDTMGYTAGEIQGKPHSLFCFGEDTQSRDYQEFWNRLRQGRFFAGKVRRRRKDGTEVWLEASYNPVLDAAGRPAGVVKIARDVTQDVVQALADHAILKAIHRSMAVISFRPDGTILTANENFLACMGYALSDIQGQQHRMFCTEAFSSSQAYREFWQQLAAGQFLSGRFERLTSDGSTRWLEASYNPVRNEHGQVVEVVKFATDITAKTEQQQRERETALLALQTSEQTLSWSQEGVEHLQESLQDLKVMTQDLQQAGTQVEDLGQHSEEIGSIVNTIKEIADQTNLLALNAAIEAARAGELGRGFSVVADEVRKLAERTQKSTAEITDKVKNIQAQTKRVVSAMGNILVQTESSLQRFDSINGTIHDINRGAGSVVEAIRQVTDRGV